ncbi:LLM class flavin-dependent oxidoreductase, partial [Streptomyces roseus]|uniref:LLM class flavin-dependent oxidoreductase n=1 Tax=Streptomyces roseus TaxID=66430 RepID=UPI0033C7B957
LGAGIASFLGRRLGTGTALTCTAAVEGLAILDATLDHLSDGRLELMIGKGNGTAQRELFHVTPEDQWERNSESYELFRRIWREDKVSAEPRFRPALAGAEVLPRPYQRALRVWHGSATSRESVELAARYGDPLFSANVTHPIGPYAELVRYYRERWEHHGHDPARAVVGAGTAGYHAARTSQQAVAAYRPAFARYLAAHRTQGVEPVFATPEDFVERSSALIGSPQQVIEKVHRYHAEFGHTVLHLQAEAGGLPEAEHQASLELFQSEIAPVLRREIPDPSFPEL